MSNDAPTILADSMRKALVTAKLRPPDERTLQALFQTMFAASVHTEEGENIAFHIAFR